MGMKGWVPMGSANQKRNKWQPTVAFDQNHSTMSPPLSAPFLLPCRFILCSHNLFLVHIIRFLFRPRTAVSICGSLFVYRHAVRLDRLAVCKLLLVPRTMNLPPRYSLRATGSCATLHIVRPWFVSLCVIYQVTIKYFFEDSESVILASSWVRTRRSVTTSLSRLAFGVSG